MEGRKQSIPVDAQRLFHQTAQKRVLIRPVDERRRPTSQASHAVCVSEYSVGEAASSLLGIHQVGPHDRPREIDVPLVRRYIRTDCVAKLALVAKIHNLFDLLILKRVRLAEVFIHQPEQVYKRRTECMTERAPIADIKYTRNFLSCRLPVPELRLIKVKVHYSCLCRRAAEIIRTASDTDAPIRR